MSGINEITRVLEIEGNAILACSRRLSQEPHLTRITRALALLNQTLSENGKIIVTGMGKSGKVGSKIAATLSSTGSLAIFLHPSEGLHGDVGIVRQGDCVLALSHSGNTEEVLALLPTLKKQGARIIGIVGNPSSRLAESSDVYLDASIETEACPHNLAPTTSTTLALAIGDAIAVALMKSRGFESKDFAVFHPAGSLGKRLNLKVADLMQGKARVGVLPPTATMDEVVITATTRKLGGILIVDENKLLGLITDGDIRRALKHREKFFTLQARQIMTQNPTTISMDSMAIDALKLMENRESQISVLPVVNSKNEWEGILRIHDLVGNL